MMKLKQRAVISTVLVTGTFILLTQSSLLLNLFAGPTVTLQDGHNGVLPREENNALEAMFGVDAADLEANLGHIQVPRKDLDLSNYTSEHRSPEARGVLPQESDPGGDAPPGTGPLDSVEVLQYIKKKLFKDNTFKERKNLERLVVLADMLKNRTKGLSVIRSSSMGAQKKPVITKEFLPHELDPNFARGRSQADTDGDPAPVPVRVPGGDGMLVAPSGMKIHDPKTVMATDAEVHALQLLMQRVAEASTHRNIRHRKPKTLWLYPELGQNRTSWQRFHNRINQYELYNEHDGVVDNLLRDLATQPIIDMEQKPGGTQLKLTFYLANKGRSIFKPMRFPREKADTLPDHFYFSDYERHHAEIASFHLDRILGFHRVPPTVGRLVNATYDVKRFADSAMTKTFFTSPAGNICFHGDCDYYCDTGHSVCGHPDMLEGSMAAYLPSSNKVDRTTWRHPWRRSYHKRKKAAWESDDDYCDNVRTNPPYNTGRRLLDLIDLAVFDFLQGNLDRHHYETLSDFDNYTMLLHLDNGRAFGRPYEDELTMSILAPIYHCCLIRYSTLKKLLAFDTGDVSLSETMRRSLAKDPVAPVLPERHLVALDRRVRVIFKTLYKCFLQNGGHYDRIIKDDGF